MFIFMVMSTCAQEPGSPMAVSQSRYAMIVKVDPRSGASTPHPEKANALEIQTEADALNLRSLKFKC